MSMLAKLVYHGMVGLGYQRIENVNSAGSIWMNTDVILSRLWNARVLRYVMMALRRGPLAMANTTQNTCSIPGHALQNITF